MFFLRRFGCQICHWTAVVVSKLEKDLRVALVGIGPEETGLKEFQDGGEKDLLQFIQETPGDFVALEDISKALDISSSVQVGVRPQVRHIVRDLIQSVMTTSVHDEDELKHFYTIIFFFLLNLETPDTPAAAFKFITISNFNTYNTD
ncbi:hypothetical protein KOW79_017288 [Hemibagrus wyckioides]|uniref:Uncharacterized protein n=1 Tax=Hemibagrus wyckioides TaxID=337641 RepID=A0A9D3SH53_9TELE|nr:hypothetical protein KOW79_017288 [Hemibagrus wyckioides]